jgi:predicted ATP-grasp superfamily ATP-dependent carboligase
MSTPDESFSTPPMRARGCAPAVVMNLYYTGLGIARSLGERGVPVIGLTAARGVYGNFTRYARTVLCPDSRTEPEKLAFFLVNLGRQFDRRIAIFPTRDDDLVFLDRHRSELEPYYSIVAPEGPVLRVCLDKYETYLAAERAGIASPRCWMVEGPSDVTRVAKEVSYPCVLKPVSAHRWRQGDNWKLVGERKAIAVASKEELAAEYRSIARADKRAVVQELVPGGDDSLLVEACYLDRDSRYVAGFEVQKLVQSPEGFGTGCIVQSVSRPDLVAPTKRLLESIGFSGVAEVEYKRDARTGEYKLIEINPRPWDQHRLGYACGVDLIYVAYCEHSGLPLPPCPKAAPGHKWIAEDAFVTAVLQLAKQRSPRLRIFFRSARGKRLFAIWSWRDPLPLMAWLFTQFLPGLMVAGVHWLRSRLKRSDSRSISVPKKGLAYEKRVEN